MVGVDSGMSAWNDAVFPPEPKDSLVRRTQGARSLADALGDHGAQVVAVQGSTLTTDLGEDEAARAVAAATEADVTVLALGGASLWFNGERTEGEASDAADISLPAAQVRLAEAVLATGKPVVLVLFQGRAYVLPESLRSARAVLVASYGGPAGPAAVAEVLLGVVNPSGKLPYSIPAHPGQVPVYHHQVAGSGQRMPLPPGRDHLYLDQSADPAWVFGHGLSYTSFDLVDLACDTEMDTSGSARVGATVVNTGARDGATVVQLYARVGTIGVTRPAQQLVGFARVDIPAGQSQRVTFELAAAQLGHTDLARQFAVEPAPVDVFLGLDSDDRRLRGSFRLTGAPRTLAAGERAFSSRVTVEGAVGADHG
jgi:beta-glucosidase